MSIPYLKAIYNLKCMYILFTDFLLLIIMKQYGHVFLLKKIQIQKFWYYVSLFFVNINIIVCI